MTITKINPHILEYMSQVENGPIRHCKEQHDLVAMVRRCFETEEIWTDDNRFDKYLEQTKYFPYDLLFPWEVFCLGLHTCTFRADGLPRWPDLFLLMGRGAGKDGYIAVESWCLTGKHNNIYRYDVDICANNEDQAMAPFQDVWNILEDPKRTKLHAKHWYWNKEEIISIDTKARIKFRTNNPKGKDGLRSGMVVYNEIHQYENYNNINVFTTGLGKKPHPRRLFATTNGDVRDGPLDDMLRDGLDILAGKMPDNGMLPFICRLDDENEVDDPDNWTKANPSLPWLPALMEQIRKEYVDWKRRPNEFVSFMTKRMNLPKQNTEIAAIPWPLIEKASRACPDTRGQKAVIGIDFMKTNDMLGVGALTKKDGVFCWEHKVWFCLKSVDKTRITAPWKKWADIGKLQLVDDVEIDRKVVADYVKELAEKYDIQMIVCDNFRFALLRDALTKIGFDPKDKNVKLIRPSDIIKIVPVIDSVFLNGNIAWGEDEPVLRWAANNTKKKPASEKARSLVGSDDAGNYQYAKIDPRPRKNDPFMAFVAAMTQESILDDDSIGDTPDLPCFTY